EQNARLAKRFRCVSAELLVWVPDDHFSEWDTHAIARISAEMLVGEEKNLFAVFESPLQDGRGVGAGADRATVLSGECLDRRSGVHVRGGKAFGEVDDRGKFAPAGLYLLDVGNVGIGAAC